MSDNQIEVKILAGSVSKNGAKLTTFELFYHRYMHSEFNTHKVISKNAASSRAIPTNKLLELVTTTPMFPVSVGKNKAGMQAEENLEEEISNKFMSMWKELGIKVAADVKIMQELGAHKQIVNRPLEAWLPIRVIATATDWDNFYDLRDSTFAQPEFALLAKMMREVQSTYTYKLLKDDEWHLPYVVLEDIQYVEKNAHHSESVENTLAAISAARCARVSHAIGGLSRKEIAEEIEKGRELFRIKHMSPFEHQAKPWDVTNVILKSRDNKTDFELTDKELLFELTDWLSTPNSMAPAWADVRNLRGWRPLRSFIERNEIEL